MANWIYQIPLGRGRKWGAGWNRAADGVLGGWEVSGIWTLRSGFPITITSISCGECNLGDRTQRADVAAGQNWKLDNRSANLWFNPDGLCHFAADWDPTWDGQPKFKDGSVPTASEIASDLKRFPRSAVWMEPWMTKT